MIKVFFLLIFIFSVSKAQEFRSVTFVVTFPNIDTLGDVYITGNHSSLGEWSPGLIKLEKIDSLKWRKSFSFLHDEKIEYKFTRGSWESEALGENKQIPGNFQLNVNKDTIIEHRLRNWKNGLNNRKASLLGNFDTLIGLKYGNLLPRNVYIYLPPSYYRNNAKKYPVFYMHDGQNIFNGVNSLSGNEWEADESIDSLIKNNLIEEIIVVGISNTIDRRTEYVNSVKGAEYCRFIVNYLKPIIDKKYRTLKNSENTGVGGSSAGGLISFILGLRYPDVFSKVMAMSAALRINSIDILPEIEKTKKLPLRNIFYLDNGGKGLEKLLQPGIDTTVSLLMSKGFSNGKNLFYKNFPDDEHTEKCWAERLPDVLKLFFGKKSHTGAKKN